MKKNYTVYKHTSPSGKVYIGITGVKPEVRWKSGSGYRNNKHFKSAIQKYGWDNFKHEILFEKLTKEEAEQKEIELIAYYKSAKQEFGYNLSTGGRCHSAGIKQSDESNKKRSRTLKGHKVSNETKRKLKEKGVLFGYGKSAYSSDESKKQERYKKTSEANKGKIVSQETRKKLSIAVRKTFTKERREEISKTMQQKWLDDDYRNNQIQKTKEYYKKNPDARKKMTEKLKGQHRSPATEFKKGERMGSLNNRARKIKQYDLDHNFIKSWLCMADVARELRFDSRNISACCRNKRNTAYGYIWEYDNN